MNLYHFQKKHHNHCTLMSPRWNWVSPTLSRASECAPPPRNQREGGPNSDDWRKSLALYLLCGLNSLLQRHNTENSKQISPEKELRGFSPNFRIHVSASDLYIPTIGLPTGKYVDRSWEYINRSQTYECGNWN